MHCRYTHHTRYDFDRPVFLEPHLIRLVPRGDAGQRLGPLRIDVDPVPDGRGLITDLSGNTVLSVWFSGLTGHLDVTVEARVELCRTNPFDYLIDARRGVLPLPLTPAEAREAASCLAPLPMPGEEAERMAERLRRDGADTPQAFALALLGAMTDRLAVVTREEPGILSPDALYARGEGACRDLAVFYMAACRHVGIPARFVSGYHEGDPGREDRDLHAWAEIWLPGGGWRGFDPSLGLAVADRHVAVAAAPDPEDAAPVFGTYRGDPGQARLRHAIRLEMC
ncbi:transglutaminase domain protein [Solidesulfovibrio fructosivorans JJ]]|uniref:Transglutaminase domain protein n=1 Tax=Solidesulfovibrio fructosivorans JJ] TaxID=596151 RepID=E1JTZ6_SOLFR|nr:transglutaminase family protein [Solidesulfovibrio fructosivorans]EFL52275.1 transglutaminase domain protein [Solidesulfovibrio fructosivorans JJ]]